MEDESISSRVPCQVLTLPSRAAISEPQRFGPYQKRGQIYNTLIEGFCDFFTPNVRKAMTIDATIATQVEGPYANGNPPAPDVSGVYPSHAQAE